LQKCWFQNPETTNPKRIQAWNTHFKNEQGVKHEDEMMSGVGGVEAKMNPRL
jgi:hypothetical protein